MDVIVDFDFGMGRTGCVEIQDAVFLAQQISANPSLRFRGIQAYWGHLQQVTPMTERQRTAGVQHERLRAVIGALASAGLKPEIVSGAGTGTHAIDGKSGLFTELQPGSFLFMDSCYGPSLASGADNPFAASLFVAASVVSANVPGRVIVNAGFKAFATDSGKPEPRRGAPAGATYRFMGDEHGAVEFTGQAPALGATIEFLTSHCDPTVNLHAAYQVVRGDGIVDVWPIRARY
jgi:D-serine deaminase-like pyridoxal phosphate-dependent protein